MSTQLNVAAGCSFPRYFRIGPVWVSAYKFFLCLGIYVGTLISATVAHYSGISALRVGIGCTSCGIVGMFGARLLFIVLHLRSFLNQQRFWRELWNPRHGGWSVFGGLLIVPYSLLLVQWLEIPLAVYWDHMIWGIVAGAVFIRFGCVCNGCCSGRPTDGWSGMVQHDAQGNRCRRIPVQWLEISWWALALVGLACLWSSNFPAGSYALAGLAWYGIGRFWLEPLREQSDLIAGVRVHRVVAALLAIIAGAALVLNIM